MMLFGAAQRFSLAIVCEMCEGGALECRREENGLKLCGTNMPERL
jgi:hypothetical protein